MQVDFCEYAEDLVSNGIILFRLEDKVMSRVKTRIWKTYSHVGIVYQSLAGGTLQPWISYMDEIYGIVSMPFGIFVGTHNFPQDRGWMIRPLGVTGNPENMRKAIRNHVHEDSHITLLEDGSLGGGFEYELKSILGIPISDKPQDSNTNIGFVLDILRDYWDLEGVSGDLSIKQVSFEDQVQNNEDLVNMFVHTGHSENDILKSVYNLLGLVNITTYTIKPPIHVFFNSGFPDFDNKFIVKKGPVTKRKLNSNQYLMVGEMKKHVAEVVAKIFEVGLGNEEVSEHFGEELETSALAKSTRGKILKENLEDMFNCMTTQIAVCKKLLAKNKLDDNEKIVWNNSLEELLSAYMSMAAQLNHPLKVNITNLRL